MSLLALWTSSVLVGLVGAWWYGLSLTQPYLYEVIMLGTVALLGGVLMLVWGVLGQRIMLLITMGMIPFGMVAIESSLDDNIKPHNQFVRVERDVPVSLDTWTRYGYVYGRVTNHRPKSWLRLATIHCTPVYANGQLSEETQVFSVSGGGWMADGEHFDARLIGEGGINWRPGYLLRNSVCRVVSADFYEDPAVKPSFVFHKNSDNQYVFEVTNTRRDATLNRVSFSCWVQRGEHMTKQDLVMLPLYQDGNSYIVKPGENVVLYNTESFAGRSLSDCAVRDVTWSN